MFPLLNADKPNTLHLFQIWLNLPARNKMADPHFIMHWGEDIPHIQTDDGLAEVTVWAGELHGSQPLKGPPKSYANVENSEVAVWFLRMKPGGTYTLPPAAGGTDINRTIYWFHGNSASVGGRLLDSHKRVDVDAAQEVTVTHPTTSSSKDEDETYFLVLQGRPIGEPVVQVRAMISFLLFFFLTSDTHLFLSLILSTDLLS
jgi:redox-sensitive bicupin YhaK (pirin superfamily)